jgi:hypothetical protein
MDWKDYVIIGGALFLLFGGGIYSHYRRKGQGNITAGPATDNSNGVFIDDLRRLGTAVATVGGRAIAEGGKLRTRGAMAYTARESHKGMHLAGTP